jgi:hypothetical protein
LETSRLRVSFPAWRVAAALLPPVAGKLGVLAARAALLVSLIAAALASERSPGVRLPEELHWRVPKLVWRSPTRAQSGC